MELLLQSDPSLLRLPRNGGRNLHEAAMEFSSLNVRTKSFFLDNHLAILSAGGLRYETIPIIGRGHLVADVPDALRPELDRLCRVPPEHSILPRAHADTARAHRIARDVAGALRLHLRRGTPRPADAAHLDALLESPEESVLVARGGSVNACVLGDGRVVLNAGLLGRFAGNDAAVAFAVGHEFGHAVARHHAEAGARHVVCLLLARMSARGGEEASGAAVAEIAGALMTASRAEMELEADYVGMLLAASAGYDPRLAAPKLFLELAADGGFADEVLLSRLRIAVERRVMGEALDLYGEALALDLLDRLASQESRLEKMIAMTRGLCLNNYLTT